MGPHELCSKLLFDDDDDDDDDDDMGLQYPRSLGDIML